MGEEQNHPLVTQLITQMNRIEGKVDTMQVAFAQMARTEERVVNLLAADTKKTEWIMQLQNRVVDLEKADVGYKAVSIRIERAIWIIVTTVITISIGWFFSSGGNL